jgi:lipoate-protein ligase B
MTPEGYLFDLGRRDYLDVLDIQHNLLDLRGKNAIPDSLILVEHDSVFTVGKSIAREELPNNINGIPVIQIERGGQWTYHGPGQLVGYPILNLESRNRDIHGFIRNLEEMLILALKEFEISAERNPIQAGVWVKEKKIASIGAAIRKWLTFHGFALNVNVDLSYFSMITPCGLPSSIMTSMNFLLQHDLNFSDVKFSIIRMFESTFQLKLTEKQIDQPIPQLASRD